MFSEIFGGGVNRPISRKTRRRTTKIELSTSDNNSVYLSREVSRARARVRARVLARADVTLAICERPPTGGRRRILATWWDGHGIPSPSAVGHDISITRNSDTR